MATPIGGRWNDPRYGSDGDIAGVHPRPPTPDRHPLHAPRFGRATSALQAQWRMIVLVLASGVFAGCQGARHEAPAPRGFDRERTIPADIETVWNAVIDEFGERDWPIDHMERASGLIATDWLKSGWLTPDPHVGHLDCGGILSFGKPERPTAHQGRFNVVVRESDDGVILRIDSAWRAYREAERVDCVSTGLIENELHAEIGARASS